jgi:hypothetical protein
LPSLRLLDLIVTRIAAKDVEDLFSTRRSDIRTVRLKIGAGTGMARRRCA